jgi:hypothetical protein
MLTFQILLILMCHHSVHGTDSHELHAEKKTTLCLYDQALVSVVDVGYYHDVDDKRYLLGNPQTPNFIKWSQKFTSPYVKHVNQLNDISRRMERVDGQVVITLRCRLVPTQIAECELFIDQVLQMIILLGRNQIQSPKNKLIVKGFLRIYGIESPDVQRRLVKYWQVQEIKRLGTEFGANVIFDPNGQIK